MVEILAMASSTGFTKSIAAVNVLNTYFGRPEIKLGAYKGPFGFEVLNQDPFSTELIENFPNGGILTYDDVPEAVDMYVDVLSEQDDKSVTVVVIGFPMNIRNVLQTNPELFESKVQKIYFMDEMYNFGCGMGDMMGDTKDCYRAAQATFELFPKTIPVYF
jgi:hypothetical protein